jgi:hypothetical protein
LSKLLTGNCQPAVVHVSYRDMNSAAEAFGNFVNSLCQEQTGAQRHAKNEIACLASYQAVSGKEPSIVVFM